MKKPEILAPAGSYNKAKTAFMYGADAVYVGTPELSLRSRAELTFDDLIKTNEMAKKLGKRIYTAINIYAKDIDYSEIKKQVQALSKLEVDGIIAADGGVMEVIKEYAPNIPLHVSTQANSVSLETSKFWYKNGAKRIILARELNKEEIRYIMENKPADLEMEMFIHGAICFGYSGRCLLSTFLANRSSNLGDCAQSCRWQYNFYAEELRRPGQYMPVEEDSRGTYIFSSKDLCLIKRLPEIINMGLDSLKIEGRLKTDYYLATVVHAYRHAIDSYFENPDTWDYTVFEKELEKAKSRGMTEFFYTDKNNTDITAYDGDERSNMEYEFGGVVKAVGQLINIEIKNKLSVGDKIEILVPNKAEPIEFTIDQLYDVNTEEKIDVVNPGKSGQAVKMKIPCDVAEGYILRRKV